MGYKTTSIEVGTRFGRLRTTGPVELRRRADNRNRAWVPVICKCGTAREVPAPNLFSGNTTSCGCYHKEVVTKGRPIQVTRMRNGQPETFTRARNHGQSGTDLYRVWKGMVRRCEAPKASNYKWYGAKGVTVCKVWREDFLDFQGWATANGYSSGLELDRIDSDGDYSPGNCRWITKKANLRNRDLAWSNELDAELVKRAKELGVSPYDLIRDAVEGYLRLNHGAEV